MIKFRELGTGPSVVLLHGTPTRSGHLLPLAEALSGSCRVLVPSLPGYLGVPALPTGPDLFERTQRALEEELLARGAGDAFLFGFSGGAIRAAELALSPRMQVRGLYLLAGFAGVGPELRQAWRDAAGALRAGVDFRPILPAQMVSPGYMKEHPAEAAAEVGSWLDAVSAGDLADELDSLAVAEDYRPAFAGLRIPITARVGELDVSAPQHLSEELARLNPRVRLELVPGRSHALLLEDADATIASVRRAVDEALAAGDGRSA